jgi:ADP-Ribosyltransferase in polyvalent proteins
MRWRRRARSRRSKPIDIRSAFGVSLGPEGVSYLSDAAGKPLRVYHGTGAVFDDFDLAFAPNGFCFTDNPRMASRVALSPHAKEVGGIANVRIAYLAMWNPAYARSRSAHRLAEAGILSGRSNHDGIIRIERNADPEDGPFSQFWVFDPAQVRPVWVVQA